MWDECGHKVWTLLGKEVLEYVIWVSHGLEFRLVKESGQVWSKHVLLTCGAYTVWHLWLC